MVLSVLLLLVSAACVEADGCPDDWIGHGESCYLFIGTNELWVQAGQVCTAHGATLVVIQSAEENLFIRGYLKVYDGEGADMTIWIGGHDMDIEGIWKWSPSGERVTYTDWNPGQPDGSRDCMSMWKTFDYHWDDGDCNIKSSFICEKPRSTNPVIG